MKYNLNSGESGEIKHTFIKGADPISFAPGYPTVTVLNDADQHVATFPAAQTAVPGEWASTVTIPDVNADDILLYSARWFGVDTSGNEYENIFPIVLHPETNVQSGDLVYLQDATEMKFVLPVVLAAATDCTITLYHNNEVAVPAGNPTSIDVQFASTNVTYAIPEMDPYLHPYLAVVSYTVGTVTNQAVFNVWIVTPRILSASAALESWINKARIENTIPQLEYTQTDLLSYLDRGLNLLNSYEPALTGFTGTNMQGVLFELWLVCASYYALGAQLQAEGALAFDFSGQAVTLNVDRTPAIESILGRIESQMTERIPSAKRLMAKYGIRGGDGSAGTMQGLNPVGLGKVGITNAPTTHNIPWYGSNYLRRITHGVRR